MSSGKTQRFAIMRHFIKTWVKCDNSESILHLLAEGPVHWQHKKLTPLKTAISLPV